MFFQKISSIITITNKERFLGIEDNGQTNIFLWDLNNKGRVYGFDAKGLAINNLFDDQF